MRTNIKWKYGDISGTIQTAEYKGYRFKVTLYAENDWCLFVNDYPKGVYRSAEGAKRAARRFINNRNN